MDRLRDRVGLNVPPLFLRLTLGVVFIWAGLGKVSESIEVSGESAAALANMGAINAPAGGELSRPPQIKPPETKAPEAKPAEPKSAEPKPAATPPPKPDAKPDAKPETPGTTSGAAMPRTGGVVPVRFQPAARVCTAADFPTPVRVRTLYGVALAIHNAANPGPGSDGKARMSLWPQALAQGPLPVYFAWAVALTELCGGVSLLLGLLTRVWALAGAGVMVGAMWLTEIGPAVQSGRAALGFLPDHATFDVTAWERPLFQFVLFGAAMALALCGPGRVSLDHALLGGRGESEDDDE